MIITLKRPGIILLLVSISGLLIWQLSRDKLNDYNLGSFKPDSLPFTFNFKPSTGISKTHNEIFSRSTSDGKYFTIDFGDQDAMNPNIIPHPSKPETYIVTAQLKAASAHFFELSCTAVFKDDVLTCISHAVPLPIAPTYGDKCTGDLSFFTNSKGPHDARVFYSPTAPYVVFGSNSQHTCFGQFVQDFRTLTDSWPANYNFLDDPFIRETEIQRPLPWGKIEKNWFLFWDRDDRMYAHYDVTPSRSFAELSWDGSVGPNLAPHAADHDAKCLAKYMPTVGPELESVHQSTNSLSVTMCKRSDKKCIADDANTFILSVFQHKSFYSYHSVYEPYVMLFERTAPFKIHAMSKRPFWIHGRNGTGSGREMEKREFEEPQNTQTEMEGLIADMNAQSEKAQQNLWKEEMFYVTSVSWKSKDLKYHGYLDDEVFVAFGIEDERAGGIDVVAGDLLRDLGWC